MQRTMTLGLAMIMAGCTTIRGSGDLASEVRTVPTFSGVEARDGVEVDLVVDAQLVGAVALEVATDDNLLERLTTEVSGDTLRVGTEGSFTTKLGMKVSGDVPSLGSVSGSDGATLTVSNLDGDRLVATARDGAVVTVAGTVSRLIVDGSDGAVLDADRLTAETVEVSLQDGAEATVCVSGEVSGEVRDGALLIVHCGGNAGGVSVSDGGSVQD